jgi:hypothetical protein
MGATLRKRRYSEQASIESARRIHRRYARGSRPGTPLNGVRGVRAEIPAGNLGTDT